MTKMTPLFFRTDNSILPLAPGLRDIFTMWRCLAMVLRMPVEPLETASENGTTLTKSVMHGVRYDQDDLTVSG